MRQLMCIAAVSWLAACLNACIGPWDHDGHQEGVRGGDPTDGTDAASPADGSSLPSQASGSMRFAGPGAASGDWQSWPDFVDDLNLADCATGSMLTVNSLGDELDGGADVSDVAAAGATLSLVEALHIANKRGGPHTIVFDEEVFPRSKATTITLTTARFPLNTVDVCIDGRGHNIVIDWTIDQACAACVWSLRHSRMLGLTITHLPFEFFMSKGAQMAGCRINTDGREVFRVQRFWSANVAGADKSTVGPGNVFADRGVRTFGPASVYGNYFGWDPVTKARLALTEALDIRGTHGGEVHMANNVVATDRDPIDDLPGAVATLTDNLFGVDPSGDLLPGQVHGIDLQYGRFVVGPGNVIRGTDTALTIGAARVTATQNAIFGNGAGIVHRNPEATAPPHIERADDGGAEGRCESEGQVELFADDGTQGETYLATVPCKAGRFVYDGPLPGGRNLTATLTGADQRTSAFSAAKAIQ